MKIRAIEIEVDGQIERYLLESRVETTWKAPESFTYKQVEVGVTKCGCGHLESEHLPECIYKVEGCECAGYVGAEVSIKEEAIGSSNAG